MQEVAQETICTLCGELGAAVKCEKITCKNFFHLKCAIACDFSFIEIKRGRIGVQSKLAARATPCAGRQAAAQPSLCCCLPPPRTGRTSC